MAPRWQDSDQGGGGMQFAMPRITPMVKRILLANVAVFLIFNMILFQPTAVDGGAAFSFLQRTFALAPALWLDWFPLLPLWQLVTYGFMHGGLGHIFMNLLMLFFLGTMLEEMVGGRRFLTFYLVTIVLAGFAQMMLGLILGEVRPILGASGGVLGLVAAVATLRPQTRIIFIIVPLTLRTFALIYVGLDLYTQIMDLKGASSGVASFAHLTGAAIGYLSIRRGWIWNDPFERFDAWRAGAAAQRDASNQERVDALLAKIAREGIQSLSGREQAFLKRVSKRR